MTPYASVIIPAPTRRKRCLPVCVRCTIRQFRPKAMTSSSSMTALRMIPTQLRSAWVRGLSVAGQSRVVGGAQRRRCSEFGEILLFTDADCEPFPDWIAHMAAPFQRDPDVVGVKGAYRSRQTNLIARFTTRTRRQIRRDAATGANRFLLILILQHTGVTCLTRMAVSTND